eukprot:GHVU01061990.1.p3 GENE.GHVU01061990.1~~GHVU01061990.1.p3  ORF type:complete len:225 (-),score=43.81 GHVU01061990.1:417-1091(-)
MQNEFHTVIGIRDDFWHLMRNVRQVSFSGVPASAIGDAAIVGRIRSKGPMTVVAGHMQLPEGVRVINKNQYITHVAAGSYLAMDVKIEKFGGTWWANRIFKGANRDIDARGFIHFHSNANPISKIAFASERRPTNLEETSEVVAFELATDGSVTPRRTLVEAADLLIEQLVQLQHAVLHRCRRGSEDPPPGAGLDEDELSRDPIFANMTHENMWHFFVPPQSQV